MQILSQGSPESVCVYISYLLRDKSHEERGWLYPKDFSFLLDTFYQYSISRISILYYLPICVQKVQYKQFFLVTLSLVKSAQYSE